MWACIYVFLLMQRTLVMKLFVLDKNQLYIFEKRLFMITLPWTYGRYIMTKETVMPELLVGSSSGRFHKMNNFVHIASCLTLRLRNSLYWSFQSANKWALSALECIIPKVAMLSVNIISKQIVLFLYFQIFSF